MKSWVMVLYILCRGKISFNENNQVIDARKKPQHSEEL